MAAPVMNRVVPDFKCPATGDQTIHMQSLKGKKVVIYFYLKDSTPGVHDRRTGLSRFTRQVQAPEYSDTWRVPRQHWLTREVQGETEVSIRATVGSG